MTDDSLSDCARDLLVALKALAAQDHARRHGDMAGARAYGLLVNGLLDRAGAAIYESP